MYMECVGNFQISRPIAYRDDIVCQNQAAHCTYPSELLLGGYSHNVIGATLKRYWNLVNNRQHVGDREILPRKPQPCIFPFPSSIPHLHSSFLVCQVKICSYDIH
jgi:hypothetical protein